MGYYTRVFIAAAAPPTLAQLQKALGSTVRIESDDAFDGPWSTAHVHYDNVSRPIVVELSQNSDENSLAAAECREFGERIGRPGFSWTKRKILRHLRQTRHLVSCQLLGDIGEAGYDANGKILTELERTFTGLVQADGEGFYYGQELVLKLPWG